MASDDSRPITFIVPGQPVEGGVDLPAGGWAQAGAARGAAGTAAREGRWLPGRVKASVRLATQRAGGTPQRLTAVPGPPRAVSMVAPPAAAAAVVADAIAAGCRHLWFQPGAEDDAAIAAARQAGLEVIAHGPCVLVALGFRDV